MSDDEIDRILDEAGWPAGAQEIFSGDVEVTAEVTADSESDEMPVRTYKITEDGALDVSTLVEHDPVEEGAPPDSNAAGAPCSRCGATPETGLTEGCPECEGILEHEAPPDIGENDLKQLLHSLEPDPGKECQVCHRTMPKEKADAVTGPKREVIHLHVPKGEEGSLEHMLIALVDKYKEEWPRDYAAMRDSVGLEVVGGRSWRYFAIHWAVYMALTLDVRPAEEGG